MGQTRLSSSEQTKDKDQASTPSGPVGNGPPPAKGNAFTQTLRAFLKTLGLQEAGLLVVIAIIVAILTLYSGPAADGGNKFLDLENIVASVLTPASWIAIMAVGMTAVIIAGGIDLSVGAILALSALGTMAVLQRFDEDASAWVVIPTAFATASGIGLLCGLLNGALVVLLRIHPFIVTLGTLYFFRGVALVAVEQKTLPAMGKTIPDAYVDDFMAWRWLIGDDGRSFIQPVPMLIMLAVVAVGWLYLHHTVMGRRIYALGGNEEAARFSGIPVWRVKLGVYAISGLTAGLAGAVISGYNGSANTNTGNMYELIVIAAAVVGGASLVGGRGSAFGALLGAIIIALIENGIFVLQADKEWAKAITGVAIILAVSVDRFSRYLHERRLTRLAANMRSR